MIRNVSFSPPGSAFSGTIFYALILSLLSVSSLHAGWVRLYWAGNWVHGIAFPAGQTRTGYVVGGGGVIVKTTDGGANWEPQVSGTTWDLLSVCFPVNASTGYTVGGRGFIAKTTDGGATWVGQTGSDSLAWLYAVDFPVDVQTGYIAGDTNSGFLPYGLKTTDGGAHWMPLESLAVVPGGLQGMDFPVDALTGYVVGEAADSCAYKTTDGGTTWIAQNIGMTNCYTVQFPGNPTSGFAGGGGMGNGPLASTTDGGNTWSTQNTPLYNCYASCFLDAHTGYIGGDEDPNYCSIEKTTDAGSTWHPQFVDTFNSVWSLDFPVNADTGYAGTASGWIYKTTDGGVNGLESESSRPSPTLNQAVEVAPNPFSSFASVPGHSSEHFALYDVSGRRVGTYRGDRIGEGLRAGVYFLRPEVKGAKPVRVVKVR